MNNDVARASGDDVSNKGNPPYFGQALKDAELLLEYAAESGVDVDANVSQHILAARAASAASGANPQVAEGLLRALTVLSARLKPVSATSLRMCADEQKGRHAQRTYRRVAIGIATLIIPFSFATFVGSKVSAAINDEIVAANALAVTLSNVLPPQASGSPAEAIAPTAALGRRGAAEALQHGVSQAEVIRQLQEFAADTRSIYARARQLNCLLLNRINDPYVNTMTGARNPELELPPNLPDLTDAATERIRVYQGIRYFAQTTQGSVAAFYGAFAACVLPVLYAVLGACAYLLRLFEEQTKTRTLTQTTYPAHFVVAAISGAVIGLFSNLNFAQGASVSPLAMAFLVGYAADVFFAFLDGIIQAFIRQRSLASGQDAAHAPH